MSPLPRIHTATTATHATPSRIALPESSTAESGTGPVKSIFADVMRAVFHPAPAPHGVHTGARTQTRSQSRDPNHSSELDAGASHSASNSQNPASGEEAATLQASSDNGNPTGLAAKSGCAEAQSSPAIASPAGNISRAIGAQMQSASTAGTFTRTQPRIANDGNLTQPGSQKKGDVDGSATSGSSAAETSGFGVSAAVDPTLTAGIPTAVVPLGNSVPPVGGSSEAAISPQTTKAENNLPGGPTGGSGMPSHYPQGKAIGGNEGTFANGMSELAFADETGKVQPEGSSTPVLNSAMPSEKDKKPAERDGSVNAGHSVTASARPDNPAASIRSDENGIAGGGARNSQINVTNAVTSNTVTGASNAAGNTPTSSTATATNGNTVSNNSAPVAPIGNQATASTGQNGGSSAIVGGAVSPDASARSGITDTHARSEAPEVKAVASTSRVSTGLHGGSNFVPAASAANVANSAGNTGLTHLPSAAAHGASDAFAALDSGTAAEHGVLLHAATHHVAVGVTDPALGWVEVRAERIGGQITAALTANSAASHAALTSVMPSMATYLQDHRAGVQHVHVETGLAGGQAGAGSQGQPSSQNDARHTAGNSTTENGVVPIGGGKDWGRAAIRTDVALSSPATRPAIEGHQLSIRA